MAFSVSSRELETEITSLLQTGVAGNVSDFVCWIKMEIQKKFKDEAILSEKDVANFLEKQKTEGNLISGQFDAREYFLSPDSKFHKKNQTSDRYLILGRLDFSPLQYVKTRLEYFLRRNQVSEEEIIDISIATLEAVENAAKYGDGTSVEVEYSIDRSKLFTISLLNNIKDFDLEDDIKRGKFSSTATLMRGMMVMQKLFTSVDLEILDDRKQASFKATKQLAK
jgi:anti-sigma regulatory factor (Ser/Thr protein kinase)